MDKELFQRYEKIMNDIKVLEEERDQLKPLLIQHIPEDSVVQTEHGRFSLKRRSTWKYSVQLEDDMFLIKERQAEEKQEGIAKEIPGAPYVEYRAKVT